MTVRSILSLLRPTSQLFAQLDSIAATGNYDVVLLNTLQQQLRRQRCDDKAVKYYLASLYLHLGQPGAAAEILASSGRPDREMKKYFAVLDYSRQQGLPLPRLDIQETRCIEYLSGAVSADKRALARYVESFGGFAVAGNSPTDSDIVIDSRDCVILFNQYFKNQRLQCKPNVHFVTPSWEFDCPDRTSHLMITGNSIFHRRSNVWRQFMRSDHYQSVFTIPQPLWRSLYGKLGAPASAGLLALAYLVEYVNLSGVSGTVAGFSAGQPSRNHSYDNVPASTRHNWAAEFLLRDEYMQVLRGGCKQFGVIADQRQ